MLKTLALASTIVAGSLLAFTGTASAIGPAPSTSVASQVPSSFEHARMRHTRKHMRHAHRRGSYSRGWKKNF